MIVTNRTACSVQLINEADQKLPFLGGKQILLALFRNNNANGTVREIRYSRLSVADSIQPSATWGTRNRTGTRLDQRLPGYTLCD